MYKYVYIYTCMYTLILIHTYIYVVQDDIYMYMYICTRVYVCLRVFACVCKCFTNLRCIHRNPVYEVLRIALIPTNNKQRVLEKKTNLAVKNKQIFRMSSNECH